MRTTRKKLYGRLGAAGLGLAATTALAFLGGGSATATAATATSAGGSLTARSQQNLLALNSPADRLRQLSPQLVQASKGGGKPTSSPSPTTAPAPGGAWRALPAFPTRISDNVVGSLNGTVYSATGWNGTAATADAYSLAAGARSWKKLAPSPVVRTTASGAFINGEFYLTGGWSTADQPLAETDVYDPATNRWTVAAPLPQPVAAAAATVLNGKLYLVGGCDAEQCGSVPTVQVYDPVSNAWSRVADYPTPVDFSACGAITGKIYCAGGSDLAGVVRTLTAAYVYDPAANAWSPIADLPDDAFGAACTAANGKLLVQDGAIDRALVETNEGFAYDPATNSWAPLPNSLFGELRGGSAPGFFEIGGDPGQGPENVLTSTQTLPGSTS